MAPLLYALFFASGASALIFETLWFRQAGLALGNSVWASSLVLSAFMGGLAIGNALGARYGDAVRRPVRAYAFAEAAIAIAGVGLVYLLPALGGVLAPGLRPILDQSWILNAARLLVAFLALLIPAVAMGLTLPLLAKALSRDEAAFGPVLGRLYGWNTLGAVGGVLACEMYLVGAVGIRGTALVAGAINIVAAAIAMAAWRPACPWMDRGVKGRPTTSGQGRPTTSVQGPPTTSALFPAGARHLALAAFLAGFALLALEVVWFRFLLLFVKGHSQALALILGIVLAGIALGGLTAAAWLRRAPGAHRVAPAIACAAGCACIASYTLFPSVLASASSLIATAPGVLQAGVPLIFPVSFLSGIFFTLIGAALRRGLPSDAAAAGTLTLANTAGAAAGSLTAGFVLLPVLGMERSFFVIAVVYGGIGLVLAVNTPAPRTVTYAAAAVLAAALALFPFGSMESRLLRPSITRWLQTGEAGRIAAVREGLTETIVYFERLVMGQRVSHAMLTNSFSMSATGYGARRYMKLYAYWPLAVRPDVKRALLVGYGVGNTAKALVDSRSLDTIDVVDLSRDILQTSVVIYPEVGGRPLDDPRVRVHVEDGRYFLQATAERFDLITGEPPPPGIAGVEHLYSEEYFRLLHDRLADEGIVTYWLPLSDLSDAGAKSILRAFCAAFEDCSLWHGSGTHLMMVGTRITGGSVPEERFAGQWAAPAVAEEMTRLGLERPGQLGALFIGDAGYLRTLAGRSPPLTDNYPKLIEAAAGPQDGSAPILRSVTDTAAARARFESSPLIRRLWPERLRAASLPYFESQDVINAHMFGNLLPRANAIDEVHRVLTRSSLSAPVLWRLGSNADIQRIVANAPPQELANPFLQFHLGVRLLSERQYAGAAEALLRAAPGNDNAFALYVYALCMSGAIAEAQKVIREPFARSGATTLPPFWIWMKETFGVDPRL